MGFPWKQFGKVMFGVGKGVAGAFIPGLQVAIETVEGSMQDAKGEDKKRQVEIITDGIFEASTQIQGGLTNAEATMLSEARSKAIDAYVAARNAESNAEAAFTALRAAIETIKANHTSPKS